MDAESILDRVRTLRIEMHELRELNTRYRRPSPAEIKARELACSRMAEIKAELATIIDRLAGTYKWHS